MFYSLAIVVVVVFFLQLTGSVRDSNLKKQTRIPVVKNTEVKMYMIILGTSSVSEWCARSRPLLKSVFVSVEDKMEAMY